MIHQENYKKTVKKEDLQGLAKRPYETPQLIIHGNMEKITGEKGGGVKDQFGRSR